VWGLCMHVYMYMSIYIYVAYKLHICMCTGVCMCVGAWPIYVYMYCVEQSTCIDNGKGKNTLAEAVWHR